ncbi:MAG: glutamate-5-semialdehyde dehydrogenase [Planctomycetales bacterium]|nr:glutamate-5-semialdehyde dehydrogenase [Planctomycetales bacterium]
MAVAEDQDLQKYCLDVACKAKGASRQLAVLTGAVKNQWLLQGAAQLRQQTDRLLEENAKDLEAAPGFGLTGAQTDRLKLSPQRIEGIADGLQQVALLPDPVGEIIQSCVRPNGLHVQKVRVPLGVIFFIYESRPNVTADAAALCVKSGNAVILRGGKEAAHSSQAIVDVLNQVGAEVGIPADAVQLVATSDRAAVGHFLALDEYISLAIPRGGEGLIRRVAAEARMPVIKHFSGNCHVYIDRSADPQMALQITVNSKCQRMGVCNAAESLLVHADVADTLLPPIAAALVAEGIELRGDAQVRERVAQAVAAEEEDYRAEFLGPIMSVRIVDSLEEAIGLINRYGSGHTDAIVTSDLAAARHFADAVDSAAVMINASTRFNDGGEFGLGAEIGISTDKFHARGPCGLNELTSYKYVAYGDGQIRT